MTPEMQAQMVVMAEALAYLVDHRVAQKLGTVEYDAEPEHEGARILGQLLSSVAVLAAHGDDLGGVR